MVNSDENKSKNNQSVLYISAHAPTKLYPQAGQKIAWYNLEQYSDNYGESNLDVVVIANKAEIDAAQDLLTEHGNRLYTYPLSKLSKLKSCLTNYNLPLKFATRSHDKVTKKIQSLLYDNNYHIIHFEYSHAGVYLDLLLQSRLPVPVDNSSTSNKIIISIHDVISQSFLRKAENNLLLGIEVARIFAYEKKIYHLADELWVLSKKDQEILTSLFSISPEKIIVRPPKLSDFIYKVNRKPEKIEANSILFWGAMDRPENEQAVIEFVNQCFHKLIPRNPEYKLYIVGSKPSPKILSLSSKNITVTGFVEDPTPYFEKAAIGIVPLLKGAGLKLKTLEMLQVGLPVISTTVGAEGVAENDNLFVDDNIDRWDEYWS